MRDVRDPQLLGEKIRLVREDRPQGRLSEALDRIGVLTVPAFDGGGLMSNDPAKHHSGTPQDIQLEDDGGAE